ncbi:M48 family metalloprotease [Synechococcales cyanobacterium C]|uniref:M48 family metalloprotease n=2 Tax=Petrachloros TaxID=2918834 RepID=A0A8K1ZWU6_9CYAN|nr:M48 family metalloprotease [Petrachloros mirabilis ULC683]
MCGVLALVTAVSVMASSPVKVAQAFPWQQLLFQGLQVIQLSNISDRQEVALGEQMHQNLLSRGTQLERGADVNRYVTDIGRRLLESGGQRRIPYRLFVVRNPQVNAYATAGGHVYFTTGLIRAASNEAELASVVGHEIGHIEERHLIKQIRQAALAQGVASAAGLNRNQVASLGIDLLINRPQSRSDEFEADAVGLRLLRSANYARSGMTGFMQKLLQAGSRTPTFLSTHPATADRLAALDREIRNGPGNACDVNPDPRSCGLDVAYHQQMTRGI